MSWCDRLASTPTVGFRLDPYAASGDRLLDSLSPILNRYLDGREVHLQVEKHESMGLTVNTHEGYRYGVDQNRVHVAFNHRIKIVPVSGGTPVLEMLSTPKPFTELLPTVCDRLIEATLALPHINSRRLERIGIVTDTPIDEDDLPPGLARFIEYTSRPWSSRPRQYNFSALFDVHETSNWTDECLITVAKPSDKDTMVNVSIDWGRVFKEKRLTLEDELRQIAKHAQSSALSFFEDIAEGSRFDEDIISNIG